MTYQPGCRPISESYRAICCSSAGRSRYWRGSGRLQPWVHWSSGWSLCPRCSASCWCSRSKDPDLRGWSCSYRQTCWSGAIYHIAGPSRSSPSTLARHDRRITSFPAPSLRWSWQSGRVRNSVTSSTKVGAGYSTPLPQVYLKSWSTLSYNTFRQSICSLRQILSATGSLSPIYNHNLDYFAGKIVSLSAGCSRKVYPVRLILPSSLRCRTLASHLTSWCLFPL